MKIEKRQVIRITKDIWTVQVLVGKDAEHGKPVYQIESKHNSLQAAQAAKATAEKELNIEDFPNAAEYLKAANPRIVTNKKH